MPDVTTDPAVALRFKVFIDVHDLGFFNSVDGLSWQANVETREEGGNNDFVHKLPGRFTYNNIKLTRPVNSDSKLIAKWFASMQTEVKRATAQIVAVDSQDKEIAQWGLLGVVPVSWTGPSFSVDGNKVATETLELAHHGFLDPAEAGVFKGKKP
ncbi:MAG: phage tail protein [Acidimicrobiales bacterium]